jgi:hypothetical protein
MSKPLINPTVEVKYEIGRVINGRERTGYQALIMDPERYPLDTNDHRWFRKSPVWRCPHAHASPSTARLCGEVYIKLRLKEEAGEVGD